MLSTKKDDLAAATYIRKYNKNTGNMDICIEKPFLSCPICVWHITAKIRRMKAFAMLSLMENICISILDERESVVSELQFFYDTVSEEK